MNLRREKEKTSQELIGKKRDQEVSYSCVISKHRKHSQEAFWTFSERREMKKQGRQRWGELLGVELCGHLHQGSSALETEGDKSALKIAQPARRFDRPPVSWQSEEQIFSTWAFLFKKWWYTKYCRSVQTQRIWFCFLAFENEHVLILSKQNSLYFGITLAVNKHTNINKN